MLSYTIVLSCPPAAVGQGEEGYYVAYVREAVDVNNAISIAMTEAHQAMREDGLDVHPGDFPLVVAFEGTSPVVRFWFEPYKRPE